MNKQIEEMANIVHDADAKIIYDMVKAKPNNFVGRALPRQVYIAEALYNAGYRKSSDVVAEVLDILSELKENYLADDDVREACAISYAEIKIVELKKKYESEGADDEP